MTTQTMSTWQQLLEVALPTAQPQNAQLLAPKSQAGPSSQGQLWAAAGNTAFRGRLLVSTIHLQEGNK